MAIDKTKLTGVEKVYPLNVSPYEQYMGDFQNPSVVSKINAMIQSLHQIGRLTNETVSQWNNVMKWIVEGGMDEIAETITNEKVSVALEEVMRMLDVSLDNGLKELAENTTDKKIDEMLESGQFESMISESLAEINEVVEGKLEGFNLHLAETVKKSETGVLDLNIFDESTRAVLQGLSQGSINAVLGMGNVKPENTVFFKTGKNLFNKNTVVAHKTLNVTNGELADSTTTHTSDYISVTQNKMYTRTQAARVCFYDANKTFISGSVDGGGITFTTPANTQFVRVSVSYSFYEIFQLEEGSLQTPFESYRLNMDEAFLQNFPTLSQVDTKLEQIENKFLPTEEFSQVMQKTKNLFNKNVVAMNKTLNVTDGTIADNATTHVSEFIAVKPLTTYTRNATSRIAYYDKNKVFISGVIGGTPTITTPENTHYTRMAIPLSYIDIWQFEEGSVATGFVSYGYNVDAVNINASKVKHDKGFVFQFQPEHVEVEGRSDITFVGDELWLFNPSADDHTTYTATVFRYAVDIENESVELLGSFTQNWGHINSIQYCKETDTLITGNGSNPYGTPAKIFLFPNASTFKDKPFVDISTHVLEIDVTALGWGDKLNVVWGDVNMGRFDICYCITNDGKNIRKVMLGKGANNLGHGNFIEWKTNAEFNGTVKVLEEFSVDTKLDVIQGAEFYDGKLYTGLGHAFVWYVKNTLENGEIIREQYKEKTYSANGNEWELAVQGITFKGDYAFIRYGWMIFVYKV